MPPYKICVGGGERGGGADTTTVQQFSIQYMLMILQ